MKTNKQIALDYLSEYENETPLTGRPDGTVDIDYAKEAIEIASIQDVAETVEEQIKRIPQRGQVQYDTKRQLMELLIAANKLGLYDAADFLRSFTEK